MKNTNQPTNLFQVIKPLEFQITFLRHIKISILRNLRKVGMVILNGELSFSTKNCFSRNAV